MEQRVVETKVEEGNVVVREHSMAARYKSFAGHSDNINATQPGRITASLEFR